MTVSRLLTEMTYHSNVMTETLSIKVPTAQKARLKALANKRKTTLSALMLQALETLARESETAAPGSCFDLSRDLFEKAEKLGASPEGDRSVNKARMKSFGRSRK
jgi:hypothetical protein